MRKTKKKALDLFCGCGGLTLGLKQAGFEVIGGIDIEPLAIETYTANHPEVCVWEQDIKTLSVQTLKRRLKLKKGELDLLAGCPPCQGLSNMRTLNGGKKIRDKRNSLICEFLRFVEGMEPKAVMMENVPKLIEHWRFKDFCKRMRELGYTLNYDVLDTADYGVPQRRKRTILLAAKNKKIEFAKPLKKKKTVEDAIGDLEPAGQSGDELHDLPERRTKKVQKVISLIPKDGGSRTDLPKKYWLDCHINCDGFKDVYGRMAWDKPAPTITSGCTNPSKGRFLHPEENRAITLREAALLQSFPSNYYFSLERGKGGASLMIGNALPAEFIRNHANKIYEFIR